MSEPLSTQILLERIRADGERITELEAALRQCLEPLALMRERIADLLPTAPPAQPPERDV